MKNKIILFLIFLLGVFTMKKTYNIETLKKIYKNYFAEIEKAVDYFNGKFNVELNPYIFMALIYKESRGNPTAYRNETGYYIKYVNDSIKKLLSLYDIDSSNFGSYGLTQILCDNFLMQYKNIYFTYPNDTSKNVFTNIKYNIMTGLSLFYNYYVLKKYNLWETARAYNGGLYATSEITKKYADDFMNLYNFIIKNLDKIKN